MKGTSRRSFVLQAAAGLAALSTMNAPADAERVYTTAEWNLPAFQQLIRTRAEVKQLYDVAKLEEGNFQAHMSNSLNGLHFGFGIPAGQILLVAAMRGMANLANFDDTIWSRYRLGEVLKVDDPESGKPATRNPYFASAAGNPPHYASQDPNSSQSIFRDSSIQALQARGVRFLSCHMATEAAARMIIEKQKLTRKPEDLVAEMQSHVHPGVLIVPSMVATIALLQSRGHFTYLAV